MRTYCPHDPPAHSSEIRELQVALKKDGFYKGPLDGIYGAGTADAVRRAKYRFGYPIKSVNRCAGQTLLDFLTGKKELPYSFKLRRWARGFGLSKAQRRRRAIVAAARWGIANEPSIHYRQSRPFPLTTKLPLYIDCSAFVTLCYWIGRAPDPNHLGYSGYGNTDTLYQHGQFIAPFQAQPGDVVIWGRYPNTHHTAVIIDVHNPSNPLCASHGEESGPRAIGIIEETRAQGGRPYVIKRYID